MSFDLNSKPDMNRIVGQHNILFVVLDALRYDVAQQEFLSGHLPNFEKHLAPSGWEKRYTPGSFTYPAHKAFFAGFLPTKTGQKITGRLFAAAFQDSESTNERTFVFQENDFITALNNNNYATCCIGGVGFFNKQNAISQEFPGLFKDSYWSTETGVTQKDSSKNQFTIAKRWLDKTNCLHCLFINVSAIHQPNYFYSREENRDDLESHAAALRYVDGQLPILLDAIKKKGKTFCIFCSDHGTSYGEDGHWGHRNGHWTVMEVPYAHFEIGGH